MIIELFLMFNAFICGMIWTWIIWGNQKKFMNFEQELTKKVSEEKLK